MGKTIFTKLLLLSTTLLFTAPNILADDNDPGTNPGMETGGGSIDPKPTITPRTGISWINVHFGSGQMWFTFGEEIDGFSATIINTTTNQSVVEYVTDSTPFSVPFTYGHVVITCITDEGITYEGNFNL